MSKEQIRKQFGENAESYAISRVHARGSSLERLVQLTNPQAHWRVLDIATGAGHTVFAFAPHVAEVKATDITPEMRQQTKILAAERGLNNVTVEPADAEALPYDEQLFHLVTCRIAPHHFTDIPRFISESARVLKAKGILAIVDNVVPDGPAGDYINAFEKLRDPSHGRCLSIDQWISILTAAGLELQQYETIAKTMNFEFWAKRHDKDMQAYLRAMLSECSGEAADFLRPSSDKESGLSFQLLEGLFIAQKIDK